MGKVLRQLLTQVINQPIKYDGLKFTAKEANSTIEHTLKNGDGHYVGTDFKYSLDGKTWIQWPVNISVTLANIDDFIYVKGNNASGLNSGQSGADRNKFVMTGKIAASGNINSLLDNNDGSSINTIPNENCYYKLFENCTSLTEPPALPAANLMSHCYDQMFSYCTSLTKAPELPATNLAEYCYAYMFYKCTSLVSSPELPATTLSKACYDSMFSYCTSLTKAPELPATRATEYCYDSMFSNCESLTQAPASLPISYLQTSCYRRMFWRCYSLVQAPVINATRIIYKNACNEMFQYCTSLNYIKIYYTGGFSSTYFNDWVQRVSSSGDFYYNGSDTTVGVSAIPTGWTVHTF